MGTNVSVEDRDGAHRPTPVRGDFKIMIKDLKSTTVTDGENRPPLAAAGRVKGDFCDVWSWQVSLGMSKVLGVVGKGA